MGVRGELRSAGIPRATSVASVSSCKMFPGSTSRIGQWRDASDAATTPIPSLQSVCEPASVRLPMRFPATLPALLFTMFATAVAQSPLPPSLYPDPPANDAFADARLLTGDPALLEADLISATRESFESFGGDSFGRTAWWRWTASADGLEQWANTGTNSPVAVTLYEQDGFGQLTAVAHGLDSGSFQTRAGTLYFLQADIGYARAAGGEIRLAPSPFDPWVARVELRAMSGTPPANDAFAARVALEGTAVKFGGSLATATAEDGEPAVRGARHRSRWWTWTAPSNGSARIANTGDGAPAVVAVYRRGDLFQLETVADSQTEFGNACIRFWHARDAVEWDTVAGQAYEIQLDRNADADMNQAFKVALSFVPAPANDNLPGATVLAGTDISVDANNFGSTYDARDPVLPGETGAGSVWYRWPVPGRGVVQVTTNQPVRFAEPSFEILPPDGTWPVGVVVTISLPSCSGPIVDLHPLPEFSPVFGIYAPNGSVEGRPYLSLLGYGTNAAVAEVYGDAWIQFDGHAGTSGETKMNLLFTPPPSNDDFANRIVLPSAPVKVGGRTFAATAETADGSFARSVWWEWTAPTSGSWVLRPVTGRNSSEFALGTGTKHPAAGEMRSVRAGPLVFAATAGDVFTVSVGSLGFLGGNVGFRIEPLQSAPLRFAGFSDPHWAGPQAVVGYPPAFDLPFVVEASSNLIDWAPVGTNANNGSGYFVEPFPEYPGARFYRTRVAAP